MLSVSISTGYNSNTFIFDRAKGLAAPAKLLVVVRGVEIEHYRELRMEIIAMMELLLILNEERVPKVFLPLAGSQEEGRRCLTRRRSGRSSSCCTALRANRSAALEIAIIRMSMEDIISIIYVNNTREKRWGQTQTV